MTVAGHDFDPRIEQRPDDVIVVAACECGWEGGGAPRAEGGYDEARHEHGEHLEEIELGAPDPRL